MRFNAEFSGTMAPLPEVNIDTDQIIPSRYLKTIDKAELGKHMFEDLRLLPDGQPNTRFPLNDNKYQNASVLIVGHNFGCGSSREHAVWALLGAGIRAVISTGFADIFRSNALKNSLLAIEVDKHISLSLSELARSDPGAEIAINLQPQEIAFPDGRIVTFPFDRFAKSCMLSGLSQLEYLLSKDEAIRKYEAMQSVKPTTVIS